jgi:hypothetical protein
MDQTTHTKVVSSIWGIANDGLRTLDEIADDIVDIEPDAERLHDGLLKGNQ